MTRDDVWRALQTAIPGLVRVQRVDSNAPAVIVAETCAPHSNHKYDMLDYTVEIPVPRMPDGLREDARAVALRQACEENTWSYSYVLGVSETWGGPSYTFTIAVTVIKDA